MTGFERAVRKVLLVFLMMFWVAALHPAALVAQPHPTGTVVSNEMCSGLFVVPLRWTSSEGRAHSLLAVFDTGGSNAFIDPDALERASGVQVKTGTRVRLENVSVAGKLFSRFRLRVRDLDHLSRALGRKVDVFLPFHAFDNYLLILDYPRQELRISRGSLPEPDGRQVFSSRGRDRRPWLRVRIGSRKRTLLIDSGSNGTISLSPHRSLRWKSAPLPLRLAQGMDDLEFSKVARLEAPVAVGSLTFENPIVALTRDTELLGAQVLRYFVVTFDQRNRRVRLEPAVNGPVHLSPQRGTGALFRPRADSYEVAYIVEDSPAERAGLRKGDRVTHIDGAPVPERGCRALDPAKIDAHRFTVRRGREKLDLLVEVKVLVE